MRIYEFMLMMRTKTGRENAKREFAAFAYYSHYVKGFGLIEIIVVTAIVAGALFGFLQAGIVALKLLRNEKENLVATLLAQEALEAVRMARDESWTNNIAPLANGTKYYPVIENGKWVLKTVSPGLIDNKYDRYVILGEVRRDAADKIAASGSVDLGTRLVTSYATTTQKVTTLVSYFTDFLTPLGGQTETVAISFTGATTDGDLANFPSDNSGNGDPVQGFTTSGAIEVSRTDLYLKRAAASPSNIYIELRATPTGSVLGTSNTITSSSISGSGLAWVQFSFSNPVSLAASAKYYIRLRSIPASTDSGSGSQGTIHWGYSQSSGSPYGGHGNEARRYIGRLSNPSDSGQALDQYDFGFKVYDLQ